MDKKFAVLNMLSEIVMSFVMSISSPQIHIYFMGLVSPQLLAFVNMLTLGIGVCTASSVNSDRFIKYYHEHFLAIIIIDVISFCTFSLVGENWVEVRFIGFAVLNALSTSIWSIVCKNMINNTYSGTKLTKFNSNCKTAGLVSGFIGSGILLCITIEIPVHICILMQCVAMITTGVIEYAMYRVFEKRKKVVENVGSE